MLHGELKNQNDETSMKGGGRGKLFEKVALVTGGGRGIGRAVAIGFALEGAKVAINYHQNAEAAEEAAALLRQIGRPSLVVKADTRHRTEVESMIDRVVNQFDGIDILVNNAGISAATPFVEITEDEWDRVIETNLKGYFLCGQAVSRFMLRQGRGGRIINVSSSRQEQAWPGNAHYCASKGGIYMLTRVMALELGPYGITVNSLSPGTILTDMNRKKFSDAEFRHRRIERIPVGRLGTPEDLVSAAVLLASDESSFINGASLTVDGGQTIW